jgi:PPOX class probable F420-dependent enzyme
VVPVCFALDGDDVVIVVDEKPKVTTRLKRLCNIEQNPATALVVDVYDADWSRLHWVMVRGSATVELGGADSDASLEALRDKYPQYRTMDLAGRPLIRIQPERVNEWYGDQA